MRFFEGEPSSELSCSSKEGKFKLALVVTELLLPTSTTKEMTLAGGGILLMLLLVSPELEFLMGTSELRLGGARFN